MNVCDLIRPTKNGTPKKSKTYPIKMEKSPTKSSNILSNKVNKYSKYFGLLEVALRYHYR